MSNTCAVICSFSLDTFYHLARLLATLCNYWNLTLQDWNLFLYIYLMHRIGLLISGLFSYCLTWKPSVTLIGAAEARRKLWEDWKPVSSCSSRGEIKCCSSTNATCRSEQHAAMLTPCGCSLVSLQVMDYCHFI